MAEKSITTPKPTNKPKPVTKPTPVKKEEVNQLKKVELEYEEFSIEIVGKISSGKIASIMQILEE